MPLQPWMQLISVDDHLIEHPKVWSDRLPHKCLDAGPRIIDIKHPDTGAITRCGGAEARLPLHGHERGGRRESPKSTASSRCAERT